MGEPLAGLILGSAIRAGTPVAFAALGETISQRAGVMNLGLEGAMLMGAVATAWTQIETGNTLIALAAGCAAGMFVGLLHAAAVVLGGLSMLASGICLFFICRGLSAFLGQPIVGQSLPSLAIVEVPFLGRLPLAGTALFSQDPLVYVAGATSLLAWAFLFRTRGGLQVRAAGEDVMVARAEGVRVSVVRVICTTIGGGLAGVGGAHLVLSFSQTWLEGLTAGRGWVAIGLVVLARWNPLLAFPVACVFGGVMAIQLNAQVAGLPVSPYLLSMLPYVVTIALLTVARLWAPGLGMPAELQRSRE